VGKELTGPIHPLLLTRSVLQVEVTRERPGGIIVLPYIVAKHAQIVVSIRQAILDVTLPGYTRMEGLPNLRGPLIVPPGFLGLTLIA
jgi:hypothetical protein